jgi:hypothetical protein
VITIVRNADHDHTGTAITIVRNQRSRSSGIPSFDGVPYTGSLIKYGHPLHMLGMLKAIREQIGKGPGDTVEVVVWKDEEVRTVQVPAQFERLLKKEGLLPVFDEMSYSHRKEYCRWITEAKKKETRLKRIEKAVEMLKKGARTPG